MKRWLIVLVALTALAYLFFPSERRMWDTRGWKSRAWDLMERESDT